MADIDTQTDTALRMPEAGLPQPGPALFAFDNSYARLPPMFFARQLPTPVPAPGLIRVNAALALDLGADPAALASAAGIACLAGNAVPEGALPIATAYAGHQFGNFVPRLGDGRAILLGEVVDRAGRRRDVQLKGAGRTPFSRGGDGRAALGPVLREYIVSEAMAALGIPTTRALAMVTTGEYVFRDTALPGAILTRVASSHIRVGTFQFFAAAGDQGAVKTLADYVIARHYPVAAEAENPYRVLLDTVIARTANLVAQWLLVGFIHGVMNTDNSSIAGETIDYGPCAFMDSFHPGTVYSAIDSGGRYAYGNQPQIAYWNLARLAETLVPLLADDADAAIAQAHAALDAYPAAFEDAYHAGLRRKLGLAEIHDGDAALARDLLNRMAANQADHTNTFRRLSHAAGYGPEADADVASLFSNPADFTAWAAQWRARLAAEGGPCAARSDAMKAANPAFIPRNHRIQAVITAAETTGDFSRLDELMQVLARPYADQPAFSQYANPPMPEEVVHRTFCGT
jgi:uncharacterized protein YdiU (UPF0061 family)